MNELENRGSFSRVDLYHAMFTKMQTLLYLASFLKQLSTSSLSLLAN